MLRMGASLKINRIIRLIVLFVTLIPGFHVVERIISYFGNIKLGHSFGADQLQKSYKIDLQNLKDYQILPSYVDVNIGDRIEIMKKDGSIMALSVDDVKAESQNYKLPRTRVLLSQGERSFHVYCGMASKQTGGIKPIEIDGIKIGVEITKIVFSEFGGGKSPFNTYSNFKLKGDARLSIWDASNTIIRGKKGIFVVAQAEWTREKFGNWLQRTNYGIHSAIDIFATHSGVPEKVIAPLDGVVYKVYNKGADKTSRSKNKVINLYSKAVVGPNNARILFRFMHLSKIFVSNGELVKKGQVIGLTGHTGFNPGIGDHLHFEMRINPSYLGQEPDQDIFATVPINPYYYLREWWEQQ